MGHSQIRPQLASVRHSPIDVTDARNRCRWVTSFYFAITAWPAVPPRLLRTVTL